MLRKEKIHILANPTSAYCQAVLEHFGLFLNLTSAVTFREVCLSACKNCTIKGWVVTLTVRMGFETMGRNRTLNSPLPCIICCCMLLNLFSNTVKMYVFLGCMTRDKKSNAENGKMPA